MRSLFDFDPINMLYSLPAVLIALSFHEFAHAYAAYRMGDDTAKSYGRLTLHPLAHVDIIGFICLMLAGFGWAKPVPIDPGKFRHRKSGTLIVSAAGPLMNLLIAFISMFILVLVASFNIGNEILYTLVGRIATINASLFIFNLIPVPPLDGSKILASFLPTRLEYLVYKYERYANIILLILILTPALDYVLGPALTFILDKMYYIVKAIINIFI